MKKILIGMIAVVALTLASCGNKKAAVQEQKADSTQVQVEVVDTTAVK